MLEIIDIQAMNHVSLRLVSLLTMTFIKGFFVFAVMYFTVLMMKKLSPEFKHLLWFFGICSFILIPVFTYFIPSFDLNILRIPNTSEAAYRVFSYQLSSQPGSTDQVKLSIETVRAVFQSSHMHRFHWTFWMLLIWIVGAFVSMLRVTMGMIGLALLIKKADLSADKNCSTLLKKISKEMGINRKIISLKRDNSPLKKKNLRRILVVFSFCLLSMSLINPVIAGDNKSPIRKEASVDEIYGRWINKEYDKDHICIPAKMIINQDKINMHRRLSDPEKSYIGKHNPYIITDSWVDRKGNSWYNVRMNDPLIGINYELWKISNFGKTLEKVSHAFEYPVEIDPDAGSYRIYNSQ